MTDAVMPQPSSAPSPSLRRALRTKYALFFATAFSAVWAFPPSLDQLTTHTYVIAWLSLLGIGAVLAMIGSFRSVVLEAIGCSIESLALASYSAAFLIQAGFSDRAPLFYTLAVASLVWIVIPVWRAGDLWIYIRTRRRLRKQGLIR